MAPDPKPAATDFEKAFEYIKRELAKVKEVWSRDEAWPAKEKLKELARAKLEPYYEYCAKKANRAAYVRCLRTVAIYQKIHEEYRRVWGTLQ